MILSGSQGSILHSFPFLSAGASQIYFNGPSPSQMRVRKRNSETFVSTLYPRRSYRGLEYPSPWHATGRPTPARMSLPAPVTPFWPPVLYPRRGPLHRHSESAGTVVLGAEYYDIYEKGVYPLLNYKDFEAVIIRVS